METTHSLDMQYKLLGVYIDNPDAFEVVENLIRQNIFTTAVTRKSYEIIKAYHIKNIKPDINIIFQSLIKSGIPKNDCILVTYFTGYLSTNQVIEYVTTLFNDYVAIYLSHSFRGAISNFNSSDPIQEMNKVKEAINTVESALNNVTKDKSIKLQFDEAFNRIKGLKSGEIEQLGFGYGVPSLDEKTLGITQGINLIAGDKGCGKTSLVINVIRRNVLELQIPVLFFSLEMTAVEIITNLIANVKKINSKALRTGQVEESELVDIRTIRDKLGDSFVIDETGGITWQYIENKIKTFRKKHNVPHNQTMLVLLDYLQIMKNSPDESRMNKEEKIEQICNELMRICKNENIAMLKLSQFSREGNKRGNDSYNVKTEEDRLKALRPRMGDLKGSSAIESNALSILLLYRPEYYGIKEANGRDLRGLCEINIVKGRYVNPEPLYVKFQGKFNLFEDYIEDESAIKSGIEPTF